MKTNTAVSTALATQHAVMALPNVTIEWNMNRHIGAVADNTPSEQTDGFDIEMFPIESIVEPLRPLKGINKARVGSGTVSDTYLKTSADHSNGRYYIADVDDPYKYWTSPYPSDASGVLANCKPQVVYNESVTINKIVITTENSWASAKTFSIQVTNVATPAEADWTEIATQANAGSWQASGQIVLFFNGTGWGASGRVDNADKTPITTTVRGVRMVVTALEGGRTRAGATSTYRKPQANGSMSTIQTTGNNSFFDLIEISARLEIDASPYVVTTSTTLDMSDASSLYPIGTLTSNEASVVLSNLYKNTAGEWVPGLWNKDNADSPYRKLIDKNAVVNCQYLFFEDDPASEVETPLGAVQEFNMFIETWSPDSDEQVTLDLMDYSKFFNEQQVPSVMWENMTVPDIVWRLMDMMGFSNYHIDKNADSVTEFTIPVFYTTGEETLWDVLDGLAKASQTAIFFDSFGVLQVKTRDFAFSKTDAPVWTFTSETGSKLSDIISVDQPYEFGPNRFKITYKKTRWSAMRRGQPVMQKVWEPEGTVVLRATELLKPMDNSSMSINISPAEVISWPFASLVNVEGELMRYDAKQFVYYIGATRHYAWVKSNDQKNALSAKTNVADRHKNHYTGNLRVTERGVWNSEQKVHNVDASGYVTRHVLNGTSRTNVAGRRWLRGRSRIQLETTKNFKDVGDLLVSTRGNTLDEPFFYYGTKMRFVKEAGRKHQQAGIVIHNTGTKEDGYYFELTPSRFFTAKRRKTRHELALFNRKDGKTKLLGSTPVAVGENIDYELDIQYTNIVNSPNHRLKAWVNGKLMLEVVVQSPNLVTPTGKFGVFARGQTKANYEYLYAVRRPDPDLPDDFSFYDRVRTGYTGNQWDREWVYKWRTITRRVKKRWVKRQVRWNAMFMDDFGPYVHEVREYDVKFDPAPVLHSRLYMTNDWSAVALEYSGTPFKGKFVLANTTRQNAIINGEDKTSFAGSGGSVNQVLTVFGRALVIDDDETVIAENADQIRIRGKIESEISSEWIQSKAMAQDLSAWLRDTWSYGNEHLDLEVFGNPLIEIGDVVRVDYPEKKILGDYFVVSISNEFDSGLSTTLGLNKRV